MEIFYNSAVFYDNFLTDYLLTSSFLGPEEVTPYALTQKYFHVMTLVVSIILMPMWSAYTQAYEKQDKQWILGALRVQMMLLAGLVISLVIMVVCSQTVNHNRRLLLSF